MVAWQEEWLTSCSKPSDGMPSRHPHRPSSKVRRVWQDAAAESLLAGAVVLIALTGIDPLVVQTNFWLAGLIPQYDPMVTMLVLIVCTIGGLVLGSIGLKASARRVAPQSAIPQQERRRPRLGSVPHVR